MLSCPFVFVTKRFVAFLKTLSEMFCLNFNYLLWSGSTKNSIVLMRDQGTNSQKNNLPDPKTLKYRFISPISRSIAWTKNNVTIFWPISFSVGVRGENQLASKNL